MGCWNRKGSSLKTSYTQNRPKAGKISHIVEIKLIGFMVNYVYGQGILENGRIF